MTSRENQNWFPVTSVLSGVFVHKVFCAYFVRFEGVVVMRRFLILNSQLILILNSFDYSDIQYQNNIVYYYMEESVLLGTKPLVDSIRHFIRDPSGVFSVCHLCECRIVQ